MSVILSFWGVEIFKFEIFNCPGILHTKILVTITVCHSVTEWFFIRLLYTSFKIFLLGTTSKKTICRILFSRFSNVILGCTYASSIGSLYSSYFGSNILNPFLWIYLRLDCLDDVLQWVTLRAGVFAIINCCGMNYCGTYFYDFGPKSQKFDPQNTVWMGQSQKISSAKDGLKANCKNKFHIFF